MARIVVWKKDLANNNADPKQVGNKSSAASTTESELVGYKQGYIQGCNEDLGVTQGNNE